MKAEFKYLPHIDTFGGLFGNWSVEIKDGDKIVGGCLASYGQCCKYAKERGVKKKDWIFDDTSRKEALRITR